MGYMNFYATKLQGQIGASDSTIQVQTPPTTTSGRLVIEPRNVQKREIIRYTGVSGTNLTGCIRGQGGTTAQVHNGGSLVQMNVTAEDLSEALAVNSNLTQYTDELMPDCVVPGTGVIAVSSGLTCTISDITYYMSGIRLTKTSIPNKTFTASKDTYCFIDTAGTITYTEVTVDAAAPATPANSILFAIVRTNGSNITRIRLANRGAVEGNQIDWSSRQIGAVKVINTYISNVAQGATGGAGWNGYNNFTAYVISGYSYKFSFTLPSMGSDRNGQHSISISTTENADGSGALIGNAVLYLNGDGSYRSGAIVFTGVFNATSTGYKTFYNRMDTNPGGGFTTYSNGFLMIVVECIGKTEWID